MASIIAKCLEKDKEKRPFASDILQMEPVKTKVQELVTSDGFVGEYKALCTRKMNLGYARPNEVERVKKLMGEHNEQNPEMLIDEWIKLYQDRVIIGGEGRVFDKHGDSDKRMEADAGDWTTQETSAAQAHEIKK